jgi:LPXTG-site transpeptidase (sortase) family protein
MPAWDRTLRRFEFELADGTTPLIEDAAIISPPGHGQRLVIPAISLDSDVERKGLQLVDRELRYETPTHIVGQYGGGNPGEGSNIVPARHVGTRDGSGGHIFRNLQLLATGDAIELLTAAGTRHYVVSEVRHVGADATDVMEPGRADRVALITCHLCNVDCEQLVVVATPRSEDATAGSPTVA